METRKYQKAIQNSSICRNPGLTWQQLRSKYGQEILIKSTLCHYDVIPLKSLGFYKNLLIKSGKAYKGFRLKKWQINNKNENKTSFLIKIIVF